MYRYEVEWVVPGGGRGVSRFHSQPAAATGANRQAWVDAIRAMFAAFPSQFPNVVSWNFASEIADMNAADGSIASYFGVTAPASLAGSASSGEYSAPSGCIIRWDTAAVAGNRRVRGRTYLVPLTRGAYDLQGSIQPATITQIQGAAQTYAAFTQSGAIIPHVYSPPVVGVGARAGFISPITGAVVPDKACVLRSRRD